MSHENHGILRKKSGTQLMAEAYDREFPGLLQVLRESCKSVGVRFRYEEQISENPLLIRVFGLRLSNMKFIINNSIFGNSPELNIGVLVLRGVDNNGESSKVIDSIRNEEKRIREEFVSEKLSQEPKINSWRQVYKSFGVKPKEYKSSVESLYKRILKEDELRHINKVVDIYNYISLKHMLPVGGEDLDKIQGDIQLTYAGDNEPAVLLLGDKEEKSPEEGEIIYKDEISAICRRFNWREATRTKLTEDTKDLILVIEGLPPITNEDVDNILNEMKELIGECCGGDITKFILNRDNPEIDLG